MLAEQKKRKQFPPIGRLVQVHALLSLFLLVEALFFGHFAFATSTLPNSAPAPQRPASRELGSAGSGANSMNQADSFQTAREQSTYLGWYMMNYGPYGSMVDPNQRQALIRGTAAAIDDCLNNRDCNKTKQDAVLQALVHRNLMQEVRSHMLVNSSNAENMKSMGNAKESDAALRQGLDTSQVNKRNPRPTPISFSSSSTRPELFQLDPASVVFNQNQQEILGPQFLNEYRGFVAMAAGIPTADPALVREFCTGNSAAEDRESCLAQSQAYRNQVRNRRFYRFVSPNPTTHLIQTDSNGNAVVDQRAQREFEQETQHNSIKAIVRTHIEDIRSPEQRADGSVAPLHQEIGLGKLPPLNPGAIAQTVSNPRDRALLLGQGEGGSQERSRAIVRSINSQFQEAVRRGQQSQEGGARGIASQSQQPTGRGATNNVVLDPARFDDFLEGIWPSAAGRQRILAGGAISDPLAERPRPQPAPRQRETQNPESRTRAR
jgi:hypothetical protein